jgi:chaperonin cofactor prefoldin
MTEKEILRKNVKDLQRQLRDAHIRIKELNERVYNCRWVGNASRKSRCNTHREGR